MRIRESLQLILAPAKIVSEQHEELQEMDRIIRNLPEKQELYDLILRDVNKGRDNNLGRAGLTAEQILKLGILRKRHGLDYRSLATATSDSISMRIFLGLGMEESLKKSAINDNLKMVKESTWERANELILKYAKEQKVETGKYVRGDCTTVQTNIHYPTDASLLNDVNRVLNRLMKEAKDICGEGIIKFINHTKISKRKLYLINNYKKEEQRHPEYLELIRVTKESVKFAEEVAKVIPDIHELDFNDLMRLDVIAFSLKKVAKLAEKVIDQAHRRIVKKEKVPVEEKLFSIFEEHTDLIVKGFRDNDFGHKILVSTGVTGLIFKITCLEGNPKDSTLVQDLLTQHKDFYEEAPTHVAFDGCFASKDNRDFAKDMGVQEITFCKNRSLDLSSLVSSTRIQKMLLNFRAGIEGCISWMKRTFGFKRILDKSAETFQASLQLGSIAYNLTILARLSLAKKALEATT